jgi:hypothetical protein
MAVQSSNANPSTLHQVRRITPADVLAITVGSVAGVLLVVLAGAAGVP